MTSFMEKYGNIFISLFIFIMAIMQVVAGAGEQLLGLPETIGTHSDSARVPNTPAGYAFSIWGYLFAGTIFWAGCCLFTTLKNHSLVSAIRWPVCAAFFLNILWMIHVPFHGLDITSFGIIIILLAHLLFVAQRIIDARPLDSKLLHITSGIFLSLAGWVSLAAFANFHSMLAFYELAAQSAAVSLSVLAAATLLAAGLSYRFYSYAYALPVIWGLAAIAVANMNDGGFQPVFIGSLFGIGIIIAALVKRRYDEN